MRGVLCALAACSFSGVFVFPAATRINDPKNFVSEVYRHFAAAQSTNSLYIPPDDIYSARLGNFSVMISDGRRVKSAVWSSISGSMVRTGRLAMSPSRVRMRARNEKRREVSFERLDL